jgi:YD repeat-containing protein
MTSVSPCRFADVTDPDGAKVINTYDGDDRLAERKMNNSSGTTTGDVNYGYDADGRVEDVVGGNDGGRR